MAADTGNVPKGKAHQQLHNDGCICDMIEFTGSWDEEAVMKSLEKAFAPVLDLTAPAPRYMYSVIIIVLLLCHMYLLDTSGPLLQ